jgi:site-specific DNA-methyltransferase (adenine-specific)
MWLYGSGFPKSLNIGKAIDKINGVEGEQGPLKRGGEALTYDSSNYGDIDWKADKRDPYTYIAKNEWEGWGTALKPANEPICLARKPLSEKTIADNVLKWKTGGLNIDGCRVGNETIQQRQYDRTPEHGGQYGNHSERNSNGIITETEGRFPANIILDEEAGIVLDEQSGMTKSSKRGPQLNKKGYKGELYTPTDTDYRDDNTYGDKGGASRFFYQAKVSKKERNMGLEAFEDKKVCQGGYEGDWSSDKEGDIGINKVKIYKNNHPTVKPVSLMAYLCKLITPPGGIVLDPFMGSGSTGIAAQLEGFRFCGMEMDGNYFNIAEARINDYEKYREFLKGK